MNRFQSNTAFTTPSIPFYRYRHLVLPPYLMHGEDVLTLWCVQVVDDTATPFQIFIHRDANVDVLKKLIKDDLGLRDVATCRLVLWMVRIFDRRMQTFRLTSYWLLRHFEGGFVFMGPAFPSQLTLSCQLNDALHVDDALVERLKSLDDMEMFAKKLTDVTLEMSSFNDPH